MSKPRPDGMKGMRHVALFVEDLAACRGFYVDLVGMQVEWQPDEDNLYLTSSTDNLALHQRQEAPLSKPQRLDHIGFILASADAVDQWHDYLVAENVRIAQGPKTHRDGARSFYCYDPDGTLVQFIHHPPIADKM